MDDSEDFSRVITAKLKEDLPGFRQRDSIQFAADAPDEKEITLQPLTGKTWYLSKIRVWTDEKPTDNSNEGSKVDAILSIVGGCGEIAKVKQDWIIQDNYHTCSISMDCMETFGQRLKVEHGVHTVYVGGTKQGATQPKIYLAIEGVEE